MGNTLCKPAIDIQAPQQPNEQPKNIEPLLTEEAIKILNIENETKSVVEPEPIKQVVELEPIKQVVEPEPIKPVVELEVEQLSVVQPQDEVSSTSSKDEEVPPPLKKKRGRKKKGEQ